MTTNLRTVRTNARITQAELARRVGIARQTVVGIENGACPSLGTAMRMARTFDTDVETLFPEHDVVPIVGRVREVPSPVPCFAVSHVDDPNRLRTLVNEFRGLLDDDIVLVRRNADVCIAAGGSVLIECEGAAAHVAMDAPGRRRFVDCVVSAIDRALTRIDSPLIGRQNDLLDRIGVMIAGRMDDVGTTTEVMIECPTPWRAGPLVSTDMQSGAGMWNDPRADLAELVPEMPAIVQISTTEGAIRMRGWGRRVIFINRMPDAMQTLRLSASVIQDARSLMDEAAR